MKVCPSCFSEFRDDSKQCDACQVALVSEQEAAALRSKPLPEGAGFVTVATSTDPFDAEAFVAALRDAGIPTFSRDRRRALVDVLVTPGASSFWEILAPEDQLDAAQKAIAARRATLDAESADAARAAEEEEAATENHVVIAESASEQQASQWAATLAASGISAVLRWREDVELNASDDAEPPVTLVLVPQEQAQKARDVLPRP